MSTENAATATITTRPKYLWFVILSYTMIIIFSNWFDPRLIRLFGLTTDAGTLIFPLTFLLSDLITEVYGYKHARMAIWCGFLFNLLFIIYGQLITHLPGPSYAPFNQEFDAILTINIRIIIASAISYFCSEPLNSYLMAKLKIKMNGRLIGLRFILSTLVAAGADSTIFSLIAFYGTIDNANLIKLILTMWLIKVFIELIGLPISMRLAKKLKSLEQLDIYDKNTKFSLLSLNTEYLQSNNKY